MKLFFYKHSSKIALVFLVAISLILPISQVMAEGSINDQIIGKLGAVGGGLGDSSTDENSFPVLVGRVIQGVTGTLSVFLVGLIFYAGYLYMTAGGDKGQVQKAKDWATNAVIGLVIALGSYALTDYVVTRLIAATMAG